MTRPFAAHSLAVTLAFTLAAAACAAERPPAPGHEQAHEHEGEHTHEHGGEHGPHDRSGHAFPHRFEDAERWARIFDDPARDAWQRPADVVAMMKLEPGMVVADLGAGTGYFLRHLAPAVGPTGRVLALDVEPDMVRFMRERAAREGLANVEAREVGPGDPGLGSGSVDRILIVDTWHHISDRGAYSKKLAAALKPGGAIFVVDFTLESEKGPPPAHRLKPEVVAGELRGAGLQAELAAEQLPDQYVVVGRP